jgi:hypothetical protein
VVWIEQLKTKREAVRASRTIAVSSVGFSEGATRAASGYGIELRRLAELRPEEVREWLLPQTFVHLYKKVSFVSVTYEVAAMSGALPPASTGNANSQDFQVIADGSRMSVNDLWLNAQEQENLYRGVPEDGSIVPRLVRLLFRPSTLAIHSPQGLLEIRSIEFDARLGWGVEEIALPDAELVHYTSPEGLDVRRIEFVTKGATRGNIRFAMQIAGGSTKATFVIEPAQSS